MKVLVTANLTEEGLQRLRDKMGFEVEYDPWGEKNRLLLADELAERVFKSKADALIIEADLCHEEVFEAKNLEFVGCCRGDPLIVDLDLATERGVRGDVRSRALPLAGGGRAGGGRGQSRPPEKSLT